MQLDELTSSSCAKFMHRFLCKIFAQVGGAKELRDMFKIKLWTYVSMYIRSNNDHSVTSWFLV